MHDVLICDYVRTPIGRYGGALASVRCDDLAAIPIKTLLMRNPGLDPMRIDEVLLGCANQAGEDNRNVARMALLLAGLPQEVPGGTVNRLCGSGMDAVGLAARTIRSGEAHCVIAGGVESMSRAPFVIPKAEGPYSRRAELFDTTIGWRFVNPAMAAAYGTDSMPETAENLAEQFAISREDQDVLALASQHKAATAQANGRHASEIVTVEFAGRKGAVSQVTLDEHVRSDTTLDMLSRLPAPFRKGGTVTAGNASGVNDGAAALLLASAEFAQEQGLRPIARISGAATAGVEPRIMGIGPVPATQRLCERLGLTLDAFDWIEFNEAFAAQVLAVARQLGLADDDPRINPNGGAIALGHPLGMSGARLVGTAALQLRVSGGNRALAAMCIGVGQGIAVAIEAL